VCKSFVKVGLILVVLMSPWSVQAAGLGKLTVNSSLGQPFKAEIDLIALKKEDIPSLSARLAPRDAFRKADVDYAPFFSTFAVSVEARSDGQPYIKIISSQPVIEPFLSMLIELNWSSGRLLREYTVLLDLPETDRPQPALPTTQFVPPIQVAPTEPPSLESELSIVEKPDSPTQNFINDRKTLLQKPIQRKPALQKVAPQKATPADLEGVANYGQVKSGDTLIRIARQVAPDGVNLNQMLIALHRANRDAFSGNNINRLKAGSILRAPEGSDIASISSTEAAREVRAQISDWNAYCQKLASASGAATATGGPKQTASGKITTKVEDSSNKLREPSKEVLKLSKGEQVGAGGKGSSQERIHAMEEEVTAKNKALNEAGQRIGLLEKNVGEMQKLLQLKSSTMGDAQKRAENLKSNNAPNSAPTGAPQAAVSTTPAETDGGASVTPASDASAEGSSKPREEIKAASAAIPASVSSSLVDELLQNIEYVGGAVALLLTLIIAGSMMGRKKVEPAGSDVIEVTQLAETSSVEEPLQPVEPTPLVVASDKPIPDSPRGLTKSRKNAPADLKIEDDISILPSQATEGAPLIIPDEGPDQAMVFDLNAPIATAALEVRPTEDSAAFSIDFPVTSEPEPESASEPESKNDTASEPALDLAPSSDPGLADINLNMGEWAVPIGTDPVSTESAHWHDIATKIDLARAYQEMGDNDGAREILEEVLREGDAQQQESARAMMSNV
jgi:pilus assembly protein FimV